MPALREPTLAEVYERARALCEPYPVPSTALALAQATLVAEALVERPDHHDDCPCTRCPRCVVRRNLLVDAKLREQERYDAEQIALWGSEW